jgi:hypothetical protein
VSTAPKKKSGQTTSKPGPSAEDEFERVFAAREEKYREWFPGDPDRAQQLGAALERMTGPILHFLVNAKEPDRSQMRRAVQVQVASFAKPMGTPVRAPRLWSDREADDSTSPPAFIRRHYSRWLGFGLTRKDLRNLDPPLYNALSVWEHRHPDERLTELQTASEVIDEKIAALSAEFSEDELRKLGTTLQSRLRRSAR